MMIRESGLNYKLAHIRLMCARTGKNDGMHLNIFELYEFPLIIYPNPTIDNVDYARAVHGLTNNASF
jgi:hypothetical protein